MTDITVETKTGELCATITYVVSMVGMSICFLGIVLLFSAAMRGNVSLVTQLGFNVFFVIFGSVFYIIYKIAGKALSEYNENEQ